MITKNYIVDPTFKAIISGKLEQNQILTQQDIKEIDNLFKSQNIMEGKEFVME